MHRQNDVHSFMYSYLQPSLEFGGVVPGCVDHFHCTSTNRVDVVLNTRTIRGHMTFAGRATPLVCMRNTLSVQPLVCFPVVHFCGILHTPYWVQNK